MKYANGVFVLSGPPASGKTVALLAASRGYDGRVLWLYPSAAWARLIAPLYAFGQNTTVKSIGAKYNLLEFGLIVVEDSNRMPRGAVEKLKRRYDDLPAGHRTLFILETTSYHVSQE